MQLYYSIALYIHTEETLKMQGAPEVVSKCKCTKGIFVGALSTLEFLMCALALEIDQWYTRDLDKSCHEMQTGSQSLCKKVNAAAQRRGSFIFIFSF